ncbi:MAG: hypothetical protein HY938_10185 [Nitrosomonadales bacterium]|nr:hypothetical protein [Nitrosomonadales bacterium]
MSKYLKLLIAVLALAGCAQQQVQQPAQQRVWIADWKETESFSAPRAGTTAVIVKDKIHLIGGVDGKNFVNVTEYAQINKDGTLGPWKRGNSLHEERGFMEAAVHGDYVYVVGGGNGPNGQHLLRTVERARINADGTLGWWERVSSQMEVARRCSKIIATDNRIYSFGGFGGVLLDSVEYAEFKPDGSLGPWQLDPEVMTLPRYINSVKKKDDRFFIIGGHDRVKGVGIPDVEWTRYTSAGNTAKWQATTPMQQGRYAHSSVAYGDVVYAIGGISGAEYLESIEYTKIGKDGELAPWKFTTPLDQTRADFSTAVYDGRLYIIGGTNRDGYLNSVIYTERNEQGDFGYWGTEEEARAVKARLLAKAEKKAILPNDGVVQEVIQAAAYTYIQVMGKQDGLVWIAGPKIEVQAGDRIGYSKGVNMSNWYSKELQRGFDMVIFVGQVQKQ